MAKIRIDKPLTQKQLAFINNYFKYNTIGEAAIASGYSPKAATSNGTYLMKNSKVLAEINKRKREMADGTYKPTLINPENIIKGIQDIALDQNNSARDRLRAFDILARIAKLYDHNINIQQNNLNLDLKSLSTEELLKLDSNLNIK